MAAREVHVLRVTVIGENIPLEAEPVTIVLGIPLPTFGKVARLGDFILTTELAQPKLPDSPISSTHGFLRKVGVESYMPRRYVHVALKENMLKKPARVF